MSFRFHAADSSWEAGFRRIACARLDSARDLIRANEQPFDLIVHQIRQTCKAMRGLIRLMRPVFESYGAENRIFREIAGHLSGARDGKVLIHTMDGLFAHGVAAGNGGLSMLRARWILEDEAVQTAISTQLDAAYEGLLAARVRAENWHLTEQKRGAVLAGLKRTYRQARNAMLALDVDTSAGEASHEWRKHVKYHGHHLQLLQALLPETAKRRLKRVEKLGHMLGERHDLDMLVARLAAADVPQGDMLVELADERAANITHKALRTSKSLFAEKPSDFIARLRKDMRKPG